MAASAQAMVMNAYNGRCGKCKKFPGNAMKCNEDTHKRRVVYANDYKCDNCDMGATD